MTTHQITFTCSDMLTACKHLRTIINRGRGHEHPIQSHFHVSVADNQASLVASNANAQMIIQSVPVAGDNFRFTVPAEKFTAVLESYSSNAEVKLIFDGKREIRLYTGRSRCLLYGLKPDDYPMLELQHDDSGYTQPNAILATLFHKSSYAMAKDDMRNCLNGVLLEVHPEQLRVVATNGHRLAVASHKVSTGADSIQQFILPRKSVSDILKFIDLEDEHVRIQTSGDLLQYHAGNMYYTTTTVSGQYPDYQRVVNGTDGYERSLEFDRHVLLDALNRTIILASHGNPSIRISCDGNKATLATINASEENAEEALDVVSEGNICDDFGINGLYLKDTLATISAETVQLRFQDPLNAFLFMDNGEALTHHVLMPVRLTPAP